MKRVGLLQLLMICSLTLVSGLAMAEGGCPPGQYPIGGQGVQGCAPIPSSTAAPRAPTPTGKWLLTWGSIFTSPSTGATGVASGKLKRREAVAEARNFCQTKGANDCVEEITYENSCVALSDAPAISNIRGGVGGGATEEEAIAMSINICKKNGAETCTVSYSNCSLPVFKKF